MNPWGLTGRESHMMDRLVIHGCSKPVAAELDVSTKTVDAFFARVMERMQVRNRTRAILMWDRWRQDVKFALACRAERIGGTA